MPTLGPLNGSSPVPPGQSDARALKRDPNCPQNSLGPGVLECGVALGERPKTGIFPHRGRVRGARTLLFSRRKIHFSRKRLELSAEGSAGGALRATFLSLDLEFSKRSRPRLQETTFRPMLGTACAKRTRSEKSTVAPRLETASQEQADRWRPSRRDRPVQKKRRNPAACAI